jgi:hypothetical protein
MFDGGKPAYHGGRVKNGSTHVHATTKRMLDLRSRHRRSAPTETSQHYSRPAVSASPLASQPAGTPNRQIKSVLNAAVSHPFIERLIGTIGREVIDRTFFWNALNPTQKLEGFRCYCSEQRIHRSLGGVMPSQRAGASAPAPAAIDCYSWR